MEPLVKMANVKGEFQFKAVETKLAENWKNLVTVEVEMSLIESVNLIVNCETSLKTS
jgi:hypothetical protein